jgi:hypothetical protein
MWRNQSISSLWKVEWRYWFGHNRLKPSTSIETRPSLLGGCENIDRSQKTTTPMIQNGLVCPVRALRCSVRSFSFFTAVVPSHKSAWITRRNRKALNTEPLLDFFYLREFVELDPLASNAGMIEAQPSLSSWTEVADNIIFNNLQPHAKPSFRNLI